MTAEHGGAGYQPNDNRGNGGNGVEMQGGAVLGAPCYSVPDLHIEGLAHDARIYEGCEAERFPTSMWYVGTRNMRLHEVVVAAQNELAQRGTTDPSQLPPAMQKELVRRYVDFEIACKTAVSELGFDPTDLRQRTLGYRARKYEVGRMRAIREEILAKDTQDGIERDELELDALVKSRIKTENAHVTRLSDDLGHEEIDTSYKAQQQLTREWEAAFTNGKGQNFTHALAQLESELGESRDEIKKYFASGGNGLDPRTLSIEERYALASEIDDVGVAGLSVLLFIPDADVDSLMSDRLNARRNRYDPEIVQYYYIQLGDMRLALEAARRTRGEDTPDGGRAYQLHFLFHPVIAPAAPDVVAVYDGLERFSPAACTDNNSRGGLPVPIRDVEL